MFCASAQAFDVTIGSGASSNGSWTGGTWTPSGAGSTVAASEVASKLASGPVSITATGSDKLTVNAGFAWSANTLTLAAGGDIVIAAALDGSATAGLALEIGQDALASGNGASYLISGPVKLATTGSYSTKLGSDGTVVNYTIITSLGAAGSTTASDLQGMDGDRAGHYALGADIDASATSGWNGGSGFLPVGTGGVGNNFTGMFDGLGHRIDQLTSNWAGSDWIGLFGAANSASVMRNLTLTRVAITGRAFVGGLVGYGDGTIVNCHVTGTVTGNSDGVGGLLGIRNGKSNGKNNWIIDSHADVTVSGVNNVGGLVGNVLSGNFSRNYATGAVSGSGSVGGLVGRSSSSTMDDNYASGSVTGSSNVGGLVGVFSSNTTTINRGFASGAVSGGSPIGGLVGGNLAGNTVNNSYWNTETTGQTTSAVGGTGLTTAQLGTGLPAGFSSAIWGNAGNKSFPYLLANPGPVSLVADPGGVRYRVLLNLDQLQAMSSDLAGNYALGADIDASATSGWNGGAGFAPVGTLPSGFTGVFDGLGRTITGLSINRTGTPYVALFGYVTGTLRNVGMVNSSISGDYAVGTLAGRSDSTVNYCYADGGSVTAQLHAAGGLLGLSAGATSDSYANVSVSGLSSGGSSTGIGGLIGTGLTGFSVSNSYATGNVSGGTDVGGLVGQPGSGTISNSYATGTVNGPGNVGGLAGSRGDGSQAATITNSYWDTTTSGLAGSYGGTAKTSAEMKQLATFAGWDLDDSGGTGKIWRIYEGDSKPLLRSFLTALTVTANAASKTADGAAYSGGNGVAYSATPNANLLGSVSYSGTAQGASAAGTYSIAPGGFYSNQQGYDISYGSGTLTISAAPAAPEPEAPAVIVAGPGSKVVLTGTTPVTAVPGSTLVIPAGVDVAGIAITLSGGADSANNGPVTIRIGSLTLTLNGYAAGTVVSFRKVTINGVETLVLVVSSGSLSLTGAAGQPLLTLNGSAVLTAGEDGSTIAFSANSDGSGRIAVSSGSIVLSANAFAGSNAVPDGKVYRGEIAAFNDTGKITGVHLGSLVGDQAGDALDFAGKPANLLVEVRVPRVTGSVARLGDDLEKVMAAALGGSVSQGADGALKLTASRTYSLLPLGAIVIDGSLADGLTLTADGLARLVVNGVVVTLAPAPSDLYRFASDLAVAWPGATLTVDEGGLLHVAHAGADYFLRAGVEIVPGGVAGGIRSSPDGLGHGDGSGNWQSLFPAFIKPAALLKLIAQVSSGADAQVNVDGSVSVNAAGSHFTLVPDFSPTASSSENILHLLNGDKWWLGQDGKVYFHTAKGVQGARVK